MLVVVVVDVVDTVVVVVVVVVVPLHSQSTQLSVLTYNLQQSFPSKSHTAVFVSSSQVPSPIHFRRLFGQPFASGVVGNVVVLLVVVIVLLCVAASFLLSVVLIFLPSVVITFSSV